MFFIYMAYLNGGGGQATEAPIGPTNKIISAYPTVL